LADNVTNPLKRPLPDGIVPEDEVSRTEDRWLTVMLGMLAIMMAIIVVTSATHALHPPSNVGLHCRELARSRLTPTGH
jgi:cytochrome c oxidase subunit II